MQDFIKLSKQISYILRHAPQEYNLTVDDQGWVSIEQLLSGLNNSEKFGEVYTEDLEEMIREMDKKRFEMRNGRIRAFYGHSFAGKIQKEKKQPPPILYHGTAQRFLPAILVEGLKSQSRQYVHLSEDVETAQMVGKRHDHHPVILEINAGKAWEDGIGFYIGNETVWLSDSVPSHYIRLIS